MVSVILIMTFVLSGCGNSTGKETQQPDTTVPKTEYLTPVPEGTDPSEANMNITTQLMELKGVKGTQIYEQQGITYGDITFESGVDKTYAHDLANELLTHMKSFYPGKQITTQAISDGKVIDSISFK